MSFVDYYEVLQVSPLADRDVIEKAYRVLISKYHPDKDGDVHKAQQINEAWNTLRDADRRAVYNIEYGRRISLGSEREPRVESDEEAFWTAYTRAVKDRVGTAFQERSMPGAVMPDWAKVPPEAEQAYDVWRSRRNRDNWMIFLATLSDWERAEGPGLVGKGVLAAGFPAAVGIPGFETLTNDLEADIPHVIPAIPDEVTALHQEYSRLKDLSFFERNSKSNRGRVSSTLEAFQRAAYRWAQLAIRSGLTASQVKWTLNHSFPDHAGADWLRTDEDY